MDRVDISLLTDEQLWTGLKELAKRERALVADVVAFLSETERRGLYKARGWRSLFEYCVGSLRWSEVSAFRRTRAAKTVLAFPAILEMLYDGRMHLEGLVMLYAFLEDADFPGLLLRAAGKTAREIEYLVAERRPNPVERDVVRFIGVQTAETSPAEPPMLLSFDAPVGLVEAPPIAPGIVGLSPPAGGKAHPPVEARRLVRVAFTADEALCAMLRRAQQLLRHKYPDGRLESVFRDALKLLIEEKDLGLKTAKAAARKAARSKGR